MYEVEYAALKYYNNIISDECLYIGMLFHNLTTDERDFRYISNFNRLKSFDDEVDLDFIKAYLRGIKNQIADNLFSGGKPFSIRDFGRIYVNEMRFSKVTRLKVDDNEDYAENITKMYLKFDFSKDKRLSNNDEKKYIRKILLSSYTELSKNKIEGQYDENVCFDYVIDNIAIKYFSFKDKDASRLISSAKAWGFTAEEFKGKYEVVFLCDSDDESSPDEEKVRKILEKNAKVFSVREGLDYVISLNK